MGDKKVGAPTPGEDPAAPSVTAQTAPRGREDDAVPAESSSSLCSLSDSRFFGIFYKFSTNLSTAFLR
jgi:hypothetical protein